MSIIKQLYQLQEVDLEITATEQTVKQITGQLGESEAVIETGKKLALEQQRREELTRQQHSTEWEIDDLTTKLTATEKELYGGRIGNPKELTNLQHEADGLKSRRDQLENKALEIMDQVDIVTKSTAILNNEFKALETEWQTQQRQLSADLAQLKTTLTSLNHKRQLLAAEIDPPSIEIYQELKKKRVTAVARVEQGICRGCRIALPVTELQHARSGSLVRCSSCGRILFLA